MAAIVQTLKLLMGYGLWAMHALGPIDYIEFVIYKKKQEPAHKISSLLLMIAID